MKILFIAFIFLISLKIHAEPNKLFNQLMNTPVDRLTFGLDQCDKYLDEQESILEIELNKHKSDSSNTDFRMITNCSYDWDNNEIIISVTPVRRPDILDKITNEQCKILMKSVKVIFNFNTGFSPEDSSYASNFFMSDGFSIGLDKTIAKELDNHIKIKIGSGVGWKCESNIRNDQKILYYE